MTRTRRPIEVRAGALYREIGIRSHGKGVFHKPPIEGSLLGNKRVFEIEPGDLVFNIVFAWEGAVAVATEREAGYCGSQRFPTYRAVPNASDVRYLELFFETRHGRRLMQLASPGSAGRNRTLNQTMLLDFQVDLPPLAEQRRIVDCVAGIDRVSADCANVFRAARVAYMRQADESFTRSTAPRVALGDCVEVTMGRQRSPKHARGDHVVPYLRAANVKDGVVHIDDVLEMNFTPAEQAKFELRQNDVLVSEGCGSIRELGASARWTGWDGATICFQNTLLRLRAKEGMTTPGYVHHLARHAHAAGWWAGIAAGTNIFHIGAKRAEQLPVPLPSLGVQEWVSDALNVVDTTVASAREEVAALRVLRAALLSDLLSGNHEIPESYDALLDAIA